MSLARLGPSLCLISVFVGSVAMARADDAPPPATQPAIDRPPAVRGDPDIMLQRFRQQISSLKLTDEQKQKIDDAMAEAERALKMLDSELQNATQSQRMQRVREIFNDLREKIGSMLDPEQQQELRRKLSTGAADRMQRLREALQNIGLSEDQKEKVKSLLEDVRTRIEAARKEAASGSQEGADKLRAAGADLREKLAQILSDEQRQKLREFMEKNAAPTSQPAAK